MHVHFIACWHCLGRIGSWQNEFWCGLQSFGLLGSDVGLDLLTGVASGGCIYAGDLNFLGMFCCNVIRGWDSSNNWGRGLCTIFVELVHSSMLYSNAKLKKRWFDWSGIIGQYGGRQVATPDWQWFCNLTDWKGKCRANFEKYSVTSKKYSKASYQSPLIYSQLANINDLSTNLKKKQQKQRVTEQMTHWWMDTGIFGMIVQIKFP